VNETMRLSDDRLYAEWFVAETSGKGYGVAHQSVLFLNIPRDELVVEGTNST